MARSPTSTGQPSKWHTFPALPSLVAPGVHWIVVTTFQSFFPLLHTWPFKKKIILTKKNCFVVLCWFLPNLNMNQL